MKQSSLWNELTKIDSFPALSGDIKTTVAIVGGGMTGLLCAYLLKEQNIDSVIIEADKIGSGTTGSTTGKITAHHGLIYNKLIDSVGEEKAKQYYNANVDAFLNFKRIIFENNIDCDFEEIPNVIYTLSNRKAIDNEIFALNKLDIYYEKIDKSPLPFEIVSGIKTFNSGQFNPLAFIKAISKNLKIYENTKAVKIQNKKVITENGTVFADKIIVASHFPFKDSLGLYFVKMHQESSCLATVKYAKKVDAMYVDENPIGMTFRNYKNYLITGGLGHRTGENDDGCYKSIENKIKTMYKHSQIDCIWSAEDCMTIDNIPYIGKYSIFTPDIFVASGYKKWGMSSSMTAAMILTSLIKGTPYVNSDVFSPNRFLVKASAKNVISNLKHYIFSVSSRLFKKADGIETVKKNEGKIVTVDGVKKAVYCDSNKKYHIIDCACHHMGCLLSFNKDEKTWDCPCHGSRYDIDGNIISNPTVK